MSNTLKVRGTNLIAVTKIGAEAVFSLSVPTNSEGLTIVSENGVPVWAAGTPGPQGIQGIQGPIGPDGPSAYEVAVAGGFIGTEAAWLDSLIGPQGIQGPQGDTGPAGADGDSGYTVALGQGFVGMEQDWLDSLVGPQGPQGIQGETGLTGDTGPQGVPGPDGISAYEVAVSDGFLGDETAWLASLVGAQGPQGIQGIQGEIGPQGIQGDTGPAGADGNSAYEIAVAGGFVGTEQAWLDSLVGADGALGADGLSAYEVAVDNGFIGTEVEWLDSLVGEQGIQGPAGSSSGVSILQSAFETPEERVLSTTDTNSSYAGSYGQLFSKTNEKLVKVTFYTSISGNYQFELQSSDGAETYHTVSFAGVPAEYVAIQLPEFQLVSGMTYRFKFTYPVNHTVFYNTSAYTGVKFNMSTIHFVGFGNYNGALAMGIITGSTGEELPIDVIQPGENILLTENAGFLTIATTGVATSSQGALADTSVQPEDLSTVATTGAYGDLSGTPTLGTAASSDVVDFATAAQGTLADTALQPADASSLYGPLNKPRLVADPGPVAELPFTGTYESGIISKPIRGFFEADEAFSPSTVTTKVRSNNGQAGGFITVSATLHSVASGTTTVGEALETVQSSITMPSGPTDLTFEFSGSHLFEVGERFAILIDNVSGDAWDPSVAAFGLHQAYPYDMGPIKLVLAQLNTTTRGIYFYLTGVGQPKGVIGPLDPLDLPDHAHLLADITDVGTAAAANTGDFATAAQGTLADTATQPGDLATVATTGLYSDVSGTPTLGTAASSDTGDFATAAQGTLADTALQSADVSSLYGPLNKPSLSFVAGTPQQLTAPSLNKNPTYKAQNADWAFDIIPSSPISIAAVRLYVATTPVPTGTMDFSIWDTRNQSEIVYVSGITMFGDDGIYKYHEAEITPTVPLESGVTYRVHFTRPNGVTTDWGVATQTVDPGNEGIAVLTGIYLKSGSDYGYPTTPSQTGFAPVIFSVSVDVPKGVTGPLDPADLPTHNHTLSEVTDAGTAASSDVGDFATAAQGTLAGTSLQPADVGTAAAEDVGFFATAAQGALADTALQSADASSLYGPLNKPSLSLIEGAYDVDAIPTPYGTSSYVNSYRSRFYDFTPDNDYPFRGIRTIDNDINFGTSFNLRVWRVADQVLIASKLSIPHTVNVSQEFLLDAEITLSAGIEYRIGIENVVAVYGKFGGFTTRPVYSTGIVETSARAKTISSGSPGTFPAQEYPFEDTYSTFDILYGIGTVPKGVTGPLDPADLPSHNHTLSEVTDAGTAASSDVGDFATAAQGTLADTALQTADVSDLYGPLNKPSLSLVIGAEALVEESPDVVRGSYYPNVATDVGGRVTFARDMLISKVAFSTGNNTSASPMRVYNVSDALLEAVSPGTLTVEGNFRVLTLDTPREFLAGKTYNITISAAATGHDHWLYFTTVPVAYDGLTMAVGVYRSSTSGPYGSGYPAIRFYELVTVPKGVTGPLDIADLPSHNHLIADVTDAGTAAASDVGDFATAAQGALADTALQTADASSLYGPLNKPSLSFIAAPPVDLDPTGTRSQNNGGAGLEVVAGRFSPLVDTYLFGVGYKGSPYTTPDRRAIVFAEAGGTLLATGEYDTYDAINNEYRSAFAEPVLLTAGNWFRIGLGTASGGGWWGSSTLMEYEGFAAVPNTIYYNSSSPTGFPSSAINGYYPAFTLSVSGDDVQKGVTGPLDIADLPSHTHTVSELSDFPDPIAQVDRRILEVQTGALVYTDPTPTTTISDTPPGGPSEGDQWWDSASGGMFIWYVDGDGGQWVETNNPVYGLRKPLSGDLDLYVATTGSDSNTGLSVGDPFLTIGHAVRFVEDSYDLSGHDVNIRISNGTYTLSNQISLAGTVGYGTVRILGDETTPSNVLIERAGGDVFVMGPNFESSSSRYYISGVKTTSGGASFICYSGLLDIGYVDFGAAVFHVYSRGPTALVRLLASYSVTGDAAYHIVSLERGSVELISIPTITLVGIPNFSNQAWLVRNNSSLLFRGTGPSIVGTATGVRWRVEMNGIICGTTYQIGSTSGSIFTGGQTQAAVT